METLVAIDFQYPAGATPLDPDEAEGLIPGHIITQSQLNEWEQQNILTAREWAFRRRRANLLSEKFVRDLHGRMFNETWLWAGRFRQSGKNLGVDWRLIPERIHLLCDDVQYQLQHDSFPPDELAARFHHRLVSIHPFANGNGRHARLMCDLLVDRLDQAPFTWGAGDLMAAGHTRDRYLAALRAADAGNYELLLQFIRS